MKLKLYLKKSALYLIYKRYYYYFDSEKLDAFIKSHYDLETIDLEKLKKSMKRCYIFGGVRYKEYWGNHFENKTWNERRKLIPCSAQNNLYIQVNPQKYLTLIEDKWMCYEFFKKYYGREMICVLAEQTGNKDLVRTIIKGFSERHHCFFIKPLNSAGGKGIKLIRFEDCDFDEICNNYANGFVLEERIVQRKELAAFHEKSLNTVRIQTISFGDHVEIKWPCLRMGRGDSVVDNVFMGGVFVGINVDNGITFGTGVDAAGRQYLTHPDTQIPLSGFQIPLWDDLCKLLKEMAMLCPDCHIIGWDMALTERGWIAVECNYGPEIIYQDVAKDGFYEDFLQIRKRLHAKRFGGYRWVNAQFKP